jgi:hypothetical protein
VLEIARAYGVVEAQRRHRVPKGTLYKWVARAYQEEGAARWPLYRRYEVVEWSAEEGASAGTDAGCEPASRVEEQQTAGASGGEPDAVDAQGTFEQARVDAREAAAQDDAASADTAESGASPARSLPSIVCGRARGERGGEEAEHELPDGVRVAQAAGAGPGGAGPVADRGARSGGHRGAARSRDLAEWGRPPRGCVGYPSPRIVGNQGWDEPGETSLVSGFGPMT